VAPLLEGRFHIVAVDFRGHGGSEHMTPPAYHFDDYVADVIAALDVLGWPKPLVVDHSMGAYVGATLAARHPERVRTLVIADMLTGWTEAMAERARLLADRAAPEFASRDEAAA
jgi:pimeloyl-ACP methyl ester carboxylesterase